MTLGRGVITTFSQKQKLNVRSYTEAELVGINHAIPSILWIKYVIEAQWYSVQHNVLHQDNKFAILLVTNGRWSSSKRMKHIKACHFLVKEKIMWTDVLTKPKHGKQFHVLWAKLMSCEENYNDEVERIKMHPDCLSKEEDNIENINNDTLQQIMA